MQSGYTVHNWKVDGLSLHARDYTPRNDVGKSAVVCLHGLTRNSKDFDALARRLAERGHRVVVPDIRGRGRSQYDPNSMRYVPQTYVGDIAALLDGLGIDRAIFIGTSMGGIITMGLAALRPALVSAAVLNDVGPEVAPEGLARIASYAGKPVTIDSWDDARAYLRRFNDAFRGRYGMPPTRFRKAADGNSAEPGEAGSFTLQLGYRPPFDWTRMLNFLGARAMKGVESVTGDVYARTVRMADHRGWVVVRHSPERRTLMVELRL